jgi:hypothetical protein
MRLSGYVDERKELFTVEDESVEFLKINNKNKSVHQIIEL